MRKIAFTFNCLLTLALVFSCKTKEQQPQPGQPVSLINSVIRKEKGTDCHKQPDSLRTDCAIIDIAIPQLEAAQSLLGKSVNGWTNQFLIHLLTYSDYNEPGKGPKTVEEAIKRFHAIHDEAAGSVFSGQFRVRCSGSTAFNDGKYVTLKLDGSSFHGGNRSLQEVNIATFDVQTGRQFIWDDVVKDKTALLPMAEAKVRETRADVFKEGFDFDPEAPLELPASFGLTEKGLLFHYQPEEIYHLGGPTEFTIPYSRLGTNLKVIGPATSEADDNTAVEEPVEETLLVACDSVGNMSFGGKPVKNLDALKATLRLVLEEKIKNGEKELPGVKTDGCLMGNSGAIRDMYAELTDELAENNASPSELVVTCDERGNMNFEGKAVKDLNALKVAIRPILDKMVKEGTKALPTIETAGCLMGASGAIRDLYEELKSEVNSKSKLTEKPIEMEAPSKSVSTEKSVQKTKPATPEKTASKPAPAKTKDPTVTLKQNGDILLNDKKISTLESLRKELQAALLTQETIPDKLDLKTVGETGMGMRSEINTIIAESITGAKWVRKKTAIATLNTAVGKKLKTGTQLELGNYQTNGAFAFISAKPKQVDGKAIDYSKTDYAKVAKSSAFADNTVGLLKYEKGVWKLLTFSIGVSKPSSDAWIKTYKAPKALFGK
jgi:hypothetical protein